MSDVQSSSNLQSSEQNSKRGDGFKRPAFMHYPHEEQADPGICGLSLAAFGLWRRMLNFMHAGTPYGHLTSSNGERLDELSLARRVGERRAVVSRLLRELERENIFSRTDHGVIYSRRMVRDERNRNIRAAGGEKSLENENVPRPKKVGKDTLKDGGKDGAKDPNKDGAKDTLSPSSQGSIGGSPSVAVAVAPSVAPSSSSAAAAAPPPQNGKPIDASADDGWTVMRVPEYPRLAAMLLNATDCSALAFSLERWPSDRRASFVAECLNSVTGIKGYYQVSRAQLGEALRALAEAMPRIAEKNRTGGKVRGYIAGALDERERERQRKAIEALK